MRRLGGYLRLRQNLAAAVSAVGRILAPRRAIGPRGGPAVVIEASVGCTARVVEVVRSVGLRRQAEVRIAHLLHRTSYWQTQAERSVNV